MSAPDLYIPNFNKNFTGVSATAASVARQQMHMFNLKMVGYPLPGCPEPITKREAFHLSKTSPTGKEFSIWHVRRNPEMRAAIWARDVLRRPIKIVFTSAAQRLHSAYPRWLISKMDAVIATTDKAATFVPNVKAIVPHGIDTELFRPAKKRDEDWQSLGLGGTHGIATVGRVRPEKGTDRFVEAMLEYLPNDPKCHAIVLGKTAKAHRAFHDELLSKVASAGLHDRIHFVGEKPQIEIAHILRASSLLVALPRYEGFGVTPLEALASGTPFIGTDVGGFKSFTSDGKYGQIVGQASISKEISKWISKATETFAKTAHQFVDQNFSAKIEAEAIGKVYDQLWNGGLA